MKKLLFVILCLALIYSCQSHELKEYKNEESINKVDTLNIEKIKIETH